MIDDDEYRESIKFSQNNSLKDEEGASGVILVGGLVFQRSDYDVSR